MSATSSSLALPSLAPKTLFLYNSKPTSLSLFSLSPSPLSVHCKPISVSASFLHSSPPSRFVPNVSISSDFDQEEDEELLSDGDEVGFSPNLKLFVGNIPFGVDRAQLAGLFESAGTVEMVELICDKTTGRSRGFGFVTMSTVEEVDAAAQQFNGYELEGRALRVNFGPPSPRREDSSFRSNGGGPGFGAGHRVYVGNLDWGVDDFTLESFFSKQGKVVEARVVYDRESGRSRGFGFVTYSSAIGLTNAIESLNGVDLNGRALRVRAAESRPRRQF